MIACGMWGSFSVWRQMRGEHEEERIFGLTLVVTASALVAAILLGAAAYRQWMAWEWGGVAGGGIGIWWWCRKMKWDFWEWGDTIAPLSLLVAAGLAAVDGGKMWWVAGWWGCGFLAVPFFRSVYRRIGWYPSGRMGFVGLVSVWWWSIGELAVASKEEFGIYWGGLEISQWVALWFGIFLVVAIYLRGGRRVTEDVRNLWPIQKKLRE